MSEDSLYIGPPELHPDRLKDLSEEQRAAAFAKVQRETFGDPEEPLHQDLRPWLEETETFGQVLKHPLVFSVPHFPGTNALMNQAYEQKKRMLEEYAEEKKWSGWVFAHERPYRLYAFEKIEEEIEDDSTYWSILGSIWTDSENIWQNEGEWVAFFSSERRDREHLMTEIERKAFAKLPETIEIYRGYKLPERKLGMSWTTNRPQAEWFARRLVREGQRAYVVSGTVPKDKALAYFLGRGESEIVALPDDITVTKTTRVSARSKRARGRMDDMADDILTETGTP